MPYSEALQALISERQEQFCLDIANIRHQDWRQIFGNDHPVFLEIGCGKGEFLSTYPALHPEWNFLGFEVRLKRINLILRKLSPELQSNVRLVTMKVGSNLRDYVCPASIDGIFIQHPDPWPKRKHAKHRLIQTDFIATMHDLLRPRGFVYISTDSITYLDWTLDCFKKHEGFKLHADRLLRDHPQLVTQLETFYDKEQMRLGYQTKHLFFDRLDHYPMKEIDGDEDETQTQ